MMIRTEFTFPSALQGRTIFAYIWKNEESKPKAVVQLIHGMQEHILRYEEFASFLVRKGFVVYGCDQLGHGRTAQRDTDFGFFGEEDGWKNLLDDQKNLMEQIKKTYPTLPLILIGHSMGSFVARELAAECGEKLDMAIFLGTSDGSPFLNQGLCHVAAMAERKGVDTEAERLERVLFGTYHKKIHPKRTHHDWLSTVPEEVNAFIMDPLCGRPFTYGGYRDMFTLLQKVSAQDWAYRVPQVLPMLFMAGKDDPVGHYGKGIHTVAHSLLEADCHYVSLRLYAGMRHELLHESRKQEVFQDLYVWICKQLQKRNRRKMLEL